MGLVLPPPHLFFFFGAGDLVQIFVHVGQMFCHWARAPGKVDYPDIETAQMMSLLHPSVICHCTEPTVRTLTHGLLDLKICALPSNWMLRLPLKDRIHPLSPFLFNSHVFHNLTVFEHALFSIFSFYVQPLLFKKTKIKTITNPPSPHRHKIISSSDISSRSTFDYLP